jgi:hypothetical protein
MSAQRNPDRRHANTSGVQPVEQSHESKQVENVSVRILFDDGTTVTCAVCGTGIEQQTRYKHLVVRDHDDSIEEYSVCSEKCNPHSS